MTGRFETNWGALLDGDVARFRLWAPSLDRLTLEIDDRAVEMAPAGEGWFEARERAAPGSRYLFVLPDGTRVPDPASRAQAEGVHGPSLVVDASAHPWRAASPRRPWEEAVIYELHVGTFTPEGTFAAAAERMAYLAGIGVTCVEIMPVAHFDGERGWGYDGVLLYAPHPAYGTPDDMRRFVEAAHEAGLMVLLDVVYNHFGPEGNHISEYAPEFFTEDRHTPWGAGIDYTRDAVRAFCVDNALMWLEEYDLDGLRLDAIDHIHDPSEPEILIELARRVREVRGDRPTWLTTEDNRNVTHLHEREGRHLYDGEWNDDLHNTVHVLATHENEGYYGDFAKNPWDHYARALAEGFAYQGETGMSGEPRGEPSAHLPPQAFVDFLQNHDQVGNRAMGERLTVLAPYPMLHALQTIHLLSPHVPLLFMGEEYGETRPFLFFTDFHGELADAVREGRRHEFQAFSGFVDEEDLLSIPDPNAEKTFAASKLDWGMTERDFGRAGLARVRRLLQLRHEHVVPRLAGTGGRSGRIAEADPGAVAIDWGLDGALWQMRANLSSFPRDLPQATGTLVDGPVPGESGELPPYGVVFFLDGGSEGP